MDRDGWLKAMNQFSNLCSAFPVNNHILFFDGHDSHFNNGALREMMCKNIQPFVLKPGESINDHPNDNGPNAKLKSLYIVIKSTWMLKYGMTKFSPQHMKFVLFEALDAFKMSDVNIIRDNFAKEQLPSLIPPNLTTNTQACADSIQLSSGSKAKEIKIY